MPALEVLSPGRSPGVAVETSESLTRWVPAGTDAPTFVLTSRKDVEPAARVGRVQVTLEPVVRQDQPDPVVGDEKVIPVGRVSVTVTESASDGPSLTTFSWKDVP